MKYLSYALTFLCLRLKLVMVPSPEVARRRRVELSSESPLRRDEMKSVLSLNEKRDFL